MNKSSIIYEDNDLLVCRKAAGVPVQSAAVAVKDMVSMIKNYLAEQQPGSGEPYLAVVHRLDQPVQGILVFAKNKKSAASLSRQVSDGTMEKDYLAVVCGKPPQESGVLVDYLLKNGKTNCSEIVTKERSGAKRAELSYRLIKTVGAESLLAIRLKTGRHHQIRVQLAGAGMPLSGDRKYNPRSDSPDQIGLAANRLVFLHPQGNRRMEFEMKPESGRFDNFR